LWKRRQAAGDGKNTGRGLRQRKDGAEGKKRQQQSNYKASTKSFHQIRVAIRPLVKPVGRPCWQCHGGFSGYSLTLASGGG
jgi:hypothetical protein